MTTREEYEAEARDEFFNDWLTDYHKVVEEEFWDRVAPEDQPLDDDMPDYLDEHIDEFMDLAREMFSDWLDERSDEGNDSGALFGKTKDGQMIRVGYQG